MGTNEQKGNRNTINDGMRQDWQRKTSSTTLKDIKDLNAWIRGTHDKGLDPSGTSEQQQQEQQ